MTDSFDERKSSLSMLHSMRRSRADKTEQIEPPQGLFTQCAGCGMGQPTSVFSQNLNVCPKCGHHMRLTAPRRLELLFDDEKYTELFASFEPVNPIDFPDYEKKLSQQKQNSGLNEACVSAHGEIDGHPAVVCVLDCGFLMGSMGIVVGDKVTKTVEYAKDNSLPLIIFSASGGARMQEGIFSLMQMAKTSAALKRFSDAGGLYISYFTHPTTGGVSASFASLGDINLSEPGALIGFAGPRVIEQTIHQKLPKGFQTAEFVEEHGFIDMIVPRKEMKSTLAKLLMLHQRGTK